MAWTAHPDVIELYDAIERSQSCRTMTMTTEAMYVRQGMRAMSADAYIMEVVDLRRRLCKGR